MTSVSDSIALITGASSGIGRACAAAFAEAGARLILVARRKDRLQELAADLKQRHNTTSYLIELDVRDNKAVHHAFNKLPDAWHAIEILVNNAGLSRGLDKVHEAKVEDWEEMIDTNIKGLLYVTRAVLPGMLQRQRGTVINIGSIAGTEVYPGGSVYCATKHAVNALTRTMRMELVDTPIRICSVDPGLVETEFSLVRFRGDEERAKKVYQNVRALRPEDVAEAVLFCATRPPHVQLASVLILPTAQATPMVIHRES